MAEGQGAVENRPGKGTRGGKLAMNHPGWGAGGWGPNVLNPMKEDSLQESHNKWRIGWVLSYKDTLLLPAFQLLLSLNV